MFCLELPGPGTRQGFPLRRRPLEVCGVCLSSGHARPQVIEQGGRCLLGVGQQTVPGISEHLPGTQLATSWQYLPHSS